MWDSGGDRNNFKERLVKQKVKVLLVDNWLQKIQETIVLRNVPRSQVKGQSSKDEENPRVSWNRNILRFWKRNSLYSNENRSSLKGFVTPFRNQIEHENMPKRRRKEGFDPNAFKLLANTGYTFEKAIAVGELSFDITGDKVHGLCETRKM